MFCPKCAHQQAPADTQFCPRCGFPVDGVRQLVAADGKLGLVAEEAPGDELSPRQKGIRRGVKLMLIGIVLIPAYVLLAALFPAQDVLVEGHVSNTPFERISEAILFTIFMCGLARAFYAFIFEEGAKPSVEAGRLSSAGTASSEFFLPAAHSLPVADLGAWRVNTGEMVLPESVTEHTTKSLNKK